MDATFEDIFFQQFSDTFSEIRQAFAQHIGMSQARLRLLTILGHQGEITHAALQRHLALDGATITRLVKQFEAEGTLSRRLDPQDNRYTLVSLTPAGQQVVAGLNTAHAQFQTHLLAGISREEQEAFLHTLERLRTNTRAIQEED